MKLLGPLPQRLPIGISDYSRLRREGYTYVDKTAFVAQVLDGGAITTLFPRPRRFGKTLNMSTLCAFLERGGDDRTELFADTDVWELDGGRLRAHFQRYPVIFLTFEDIKRTTWEDTWAELRKRLQVEIERVWTRHDLGDGADSLRVHYHRQMMAETASPIDLTMMLSDLTGWLRQATGERVVILIDDYDAPLQAACEHGYWARASEFIGAFLAGGLKDQPNVHCGVLTGILPVILADDFGGLNNVRSSSLLDPTSANDFGFTQEEVTALAHRADQEAALPGLREWYGGYRFGGTRPVTLYNTGSVLSYLAEPADGLRPCWTDTSRDALVNALLVTGAGEVGPDIATLRAGGTVDRVIAGSVPLQHLRDARDALWSVLTFSGYVTPESANLTRRGCEVVLRIPNQEVLAVFEDGFERFLTRSSAGPNPVMQLVAAMLRGDVEELSARLERLLIGAMSYHDFGREPVEAIYQAFFVGLLVHLERTHRVTSNREAGFGRADILVSPRTPGPGAVLELKVVTRRETPEEALERAVAQLRDRDYAAEVRAAGATEVHQYAVVFDGKRAWLQIV